MVTTIYGCTRRRATTLWGSRDDYILLHISDGSPARRAAAALQYCLWPTCAAAATTTAMYIYSQYILHRERWRCMRRKNMRTCIDGNNMCIWCFKPTAQESMKPWMYLYLAYPSTWHTNIYIYSIFPFLKKYTPYFVLWDIRHTILFLWYFILLFYFCGGTPYYIFFYEVHTTYFILHTIFFRVTPYYILGSSAYSILFCTLIYYEVHASWYFILHTPYFRTSYSI